MLAAQCCVRHVILPVDRLFVDHLSYRSSAQQDPSALGASTSPMSLSSNSTTCLFCQSRLLTLPARIGSRAGRRYFTRPTFAPKPVLDVKHITKNPGLYEQNCLDRNYKHQSRNSWRILELSQRRAKLRASSNDLRLRNADARKKIERLRLTERDTKRQLTDNALMSGLMQAAKRMKDELSTVQAEEDTIDREIEELALSLPNLSSTHTPNGSEHKIVSENIPAVPLTNLSGASHVDIGSALGLLDFAAAAQTSGWGWYFLAGEAALLEQALVQFALAKLLQHQWRIVSPPSIVYGHVAAACGFQPRDQHDEQQIYAIQRPERDNSPDKPQLCLAGTAEIPLAGMNANKTLDVGSLPLKTAAVSRCYRAEAGARGVDSKGLYRVHEFTKVEMFAWTAPDDFGEQMFNDNIHASPSTAVFEEMIELQQSLLKALGLRYRVLEMPAHDLGASASRKIDIEAFFPSRKQHGDGWGEVTSTSICTDYQARRLATRVRTKSSALEYAWTVNGTAMAVPRVLAALLETGWDPQSRVVNIPECLWPYMHGITKIRSPSPAQL